jgi:peptidyl-prolyl cis-trans isomerase SurA
VSGQVEGDRVIAVVGNDIITESDFQYQIQMYARQYQLSEINPFIAQQLFQSMLTNKIILAKAEQDSIIVTEDEISRELDSRMKALVSQVGSEEKLTEVYGMSIPKIKSVIKEDLQKNLKVEKLKRRRFQAGMKVSDKEVREFFRLYKDSLPEQTDEYELARILMVRKVSDPEKEEAKRIAQEILDSIDQDVDFSELAKRHSGDSLSAIQGGDLGFATKGIFVKEFEEAVYSLKPGEVSGLVETQFGYHIIKLNEKQGDKVRSQHILIKYPKFESSDFETIAFLKDLKGKITSGEITFEEAAELYSQDEDSKLKGGLVGIIPVENIDSNVVENLKAISEGQVTDPVRVGNNDQYGYEIYKLIKFYPSHELSIDTDYDKIKRFAESFKESQEMEKWIKDISESIYIDVRM